MTDDERQDQAAADQEARIEEIPDTGNAEVDARLAALEQRATEEMDNAETAMKSAAGALREFYAAIRTTREALRERGFPLVNEMEPRK